MTLYSLALGLHLLCVVAAAAASGMALQSALRLRAANDLTQIQNTMTEIGRTVRVFPPATLGLFATGGYMTHQRWTWSVPWIDAALVALGLITALGKGVEASRTQALRREIESSGMSPRARRLVRDPLAWSAKMTTLTLFVSVVFLMTMKSQDSERALDDLRATVGSRAG